MTKSLFVKIDQPLQKLAGYQMSHDPKKWDVEIIKYLHETHPYLTDHTIKIIFNARDDDKATATGDIFVDNKMDIPFVIDQGELQPLDMFMHGGDLIPMTRTSVSSALMDTGFGTPIPAGSGETADIFNTNAVPPFDGKYTFAADNCYDKETAAERIRRHEASIGMPENPGKSAGVDCDMTIAESGTRYFPGDDSALDKVLNSISTDPKYHYSYGAKTASALPRVQPLYESETKELTPDQNWCVKTATGIDISGRSYAGFLDPFTGHVSGKPVFLASKGEGYAEVPQVVGEIEKIGSLDESTKKNEFHTCDPEVGDIGCFCWNGGVTHPIKIAQVLEDGYLVAQLDGQMTATIRPTDGIKTASYMDDLYIPGDAVFHKTLDKELLLSTPLSKVATVSVIYSNGQYALNGDGFKPEPCSYIYTKRALCEHFEKESVQDLLKFAARKGFVRIKAPSVFNKTAAAGGIKIPQKYIKKANIAPTSEWEAIMCINSVDLEPFSIFKKAPGWVGKIAAELTNDTKADTVDAILGSNFLTEETMFKFLDKIEHFKKARRCALEMLLASRLGLEVPQGPLRSAAFALDGIVNSLEQLRHMLTAGEG